MSDFILNVKNRADAGKGASRRLRALNNDVPAIIYGGTAAPVSISIPHKDLAKAAEDETFFAHILTLRVEGKDEKVVVKDMQRHPAKPIILHADFQRVDDTHFITMHVPLHFLNEEACVGVKQQGGVINHDRAELVVRCLPQNLPEFIEVDMLAVKLGDVLHISDIKLPTAVSSVDLSHGHDHPVVHVVAPKVSGEAAAE